MSQITITSDSTRYVVTSYYQIPSVNTRICRLWRPDNRYPGEAIVHRHESGGIVLTFTGTQHNSQDTVKVISVEDVDKFILSCLEVAHVTSVSGKG